MHVTYGAEVFFKYRSADKEESEYVVAFFSQHTLAVCTS